MARRAPHGLAVVTLAVALAGCGGDDSGGGDESASERADNEVRISKADVGRGEWPLTVRAGVVRCEGAAGSGAVTFEANGRVYGVNGTAISQGLPRIDPIWKKNPDIPGTRINISPVLDRGLKLCK